MSIQPLISKNKGKGKKLKETSLHGSVSRVEDSLEHTLEFSDARFAKYIVVCWSHY